MSEDTKHLPSQFEWPNIPMLSVITGVNGTGKTALLYSIFYKHPTLREFSIAKDVILEFNPSNEAYHCLSSGERFTLLNLLLNFPPCAKFLQNQVKLGSILLLDEPDAHLHPSLIKDFMEYIYTLVNEYKIQVIMTTHSPETVALIRKENKRSLFVMDHDSNTKQVYIKQAVNKYQAIRLLTSDVIQINDSFRLVFVESPFDKSFYEYVNSYVMKKRFLNNVQQLIFRYYSTGTLKEENKKFSTIRTIKGRYFNDVQRLVEKFTTVCGETKPLENFVYGLVNQDYLEYLEPFRRKHVTNPYKQKYNVIAVNRCSPVNYILDPIHIYYYALTHNKLNIYNGEELTFSLNPSCDLDYQSLQGVINRLFPEGNFPNTENVYFQPNFHLKYPLEVLNWNEADLIQHYNGLSCFSNLNLKPDDVFDCLKNSDMLIPLDLLDSFDYLNSEDPQNHRCHQTLVTRKKKVVTTN
ncbi:unnamed protein product [Adineta steineri]|uniref:AAA+ ATPase domain-containing protein n=1 Tax=Adineta steineri TaxID=433720 RepID=A0A815SZC1_9BILA|nr:unnamed protein product [Adineta steineri]CAF3535483.1 unnamed protein product [Adineta steineri]